MKHDENKSIEPISLSPIQRKLLIIEGKDVIAEYLSHTLACYGNICIARDTEEAVNKISVTSFDAIVFNVRLPELNGIDFYKEAYKLDSSVNRKILFLLDTADKLQIKFMLDNHLPCLRKPLQSESIQSALGNILLHKKSPQAEFKASA